MTLALTRQELEYLLSLPHLLTDEEATEVARCLEVLGPEIEKEDTEAEADRLRSSFKYFFMKAWPHLEPRKLVMGWHIEMACDYLQALEERKFLNLLINIPPGFSKSVCVSAIWPAWVWARDPGATFFGVSYVDKLAIRDSQKTRTLMRSDWYRRYFDIDIVVDKAEYFRLSTGGWRWASTPGGFATGEHFSHLIVDDANNAKKSESKAERQAVNEWWDLTMSTRGIGLGRVTAGVMQRFHKQDWAGHFLSKTEDVAHLVLPMRYETNKDGSPRNKDIGLGRDPRKEPGQLLDPVRYPEPVVKTLERNLGMYGSAGQLQQRPTVRDGAVFKTEWIEIVERDRVPWQRITRFVRGWDRASTRNAGDYSAGVLLGVIEGDKDNPTEVYILDVIRQRWSSAKIQRTIEIYCEMEETRFGKHKMQTAIEREPMGSGKQVAEMTINKLMGHRVRCLAPSGSKEVRAEPFSIAVENRDVKMVLAKWNAEYIDELSGFPKGDHDDQVDASSLAFMVLMGGGDFQLPEPDDSNPSETTGSAPCQNKLCDHLSEGGGYCCENCEALDKAGEDIRRSPAQDAHAKPCMQRHAILSRKGLWEPNAEIE